MSQLQLPKLLDHWTAPQGAGDPIGCLSTTFTLETQFFEDHCLARYLNMQTDLDTDLRLYLIEREEKMAGVQCAAVLADYRQCQGMHSPRWDLIPVRTPGIMHAKISLLCWANHIRLLIASANMTPSGYRSNQEIFSVMDYHPGSQAPLGVIDKVLPYLTSLMQEQKEMAPAAADRVLGLLNKTREQVKTWGKAGHVVAGDQFFIYPLLLAPGKANTRNLFDGIKKIWNRHAAGPAKNACVVSPFFDSAESKNKPAELIWDLLAPDAGASVSYSLTTRSGAEKGELVVNAPETLLTKRPSGVPRSRVKFNKILETLKEGTGEVYRPLHLKSIRLEDEEWVLMLIGSSNFTTGGLGLSTRNMTQREANLVYMVHKGKQAKTYKALYGAWPQEAAIKERMVWQPLPNEEETEGLMQTPLHDFFGSATLAQGPAGEKQLHLVFTGSTPPESFQLFDQQDKLVYSYADWVNMGQALDVTLEWNGAFLPSHLLVWWPGIGSKAWWPVNVQNYSLLPPPEELQRLSLETLILALGSNRPLYQVLAKQMPHAGQAPVGHQAADLVDLDPHKMVDTSRFLLQRTRRISAGMRALHERLSRPVYTREALDWRINGPIGVKALADAICKEARTEDEMAFILAELAMEIAAVKPESKDHVLSAQLIRESLQTMVTKLEAMLPQASIPKDLELYVKEAFKKAKQAV